MSVIKGVKVGTTEVTGTYDTQSDDESLEITAVSLDSIDTPSDVVYTGNAFTPTPSVYAIVDGQNTLLEKDKDYTLTYSDNTNAGTAKVTATGINNFSGSVFTEWTISKADINVQKSDQSFIYDGYVHGDGVTISTVGSQDATVKFYFKAGGDSTYTPSSYNLTDYPQITNVSESGMVYYQVTADNHNDATGYYKLEIRPETAYLVWGDITWRYDGKEHSTTCTVGNLIGSDTCTVNLTGNSITDIGTTTVTTSSLSNSNYTLDSQETRTLTVLAAFFIKVSGSWTPVKRVYKKVSGKWELTEIKNLYDGNNPFSTDGRYVQSQS